MERANKDYVGAINPVIRLSLLQFTLGFPPPTYHLKLVENAAIILPDKLSASGDGDIKLKVSQSPRQFQVSVSPYLFFEGVSHFPWRVPPPQINTTSRMTC